MPQYFMQTLFIPAAFCCIFVLCAVNDAKSYKIPDRLNACLFVGVLFISLLGLYPISINSVLFSFLFFYPFLFTVWWGKSISGETELSISDSKQTFLETLRDILPTVILPSPVSWLILMIVSVILLGKIFLIPLAVAFLCFSVILLFKNKKCWMGGGDKKMLASCMAMAGIEGASQFAITLSICNLFLIGWLSIYRNNRKKAGFVYETQWHSRRVPMGIAIAAAGIITLLIPKLSIAL